MDAATEKMYGALAGWWPLLSAPEDYAEEAALFGDILLGADSGTKTVLELGSGGGSNASHLKRRFAMTLCDRAPGMLAVSRRLNPELEHVEGDMREVRLGRTFDAVLIHDAVMYLTSERDVGAALATASVHCRPGGHLLVVPDFFRETFMTSADHGGYDADGRGLRYLEWITDPDPGDTTVDCDFAYLLRDRDGTLTVEQDHHTFGIFARDTWLRLFGEAGFDPRIVPVPHSQCQPGSYNAVIGKKVAGRDCEP
jgi:SAM-dependent methyltransferase